MGDKNLSTSPKDNRVPSRLPYDNPNPTTSSRYKATPIRYRSSERPCTTGGFSHFNRNLKTYTEIFQSRQMMAEHESSERDKIKKLARRPYQFGESSGPTNQTEAPKKKSLQKWSHSRGDFAAQQGAENQQEVSEPNMEIIFQARSPFSNSVTNIDPRTRIPTLAHGGKELDKKTSLDPDSSARLNRGSVSEGIHPPSSPWDGKVKAPYQSPPKAVASNIHANTINTTNSNPDREVARTRLFCNRNVRSAQASQLLTPPLPRPQSSTKQMNDLQIGDTAPSERSGPVTPVKKEVVAAAVEVAEMHAKSAIHQSSPYSVEYIKIGRRLDDNEDDDDDDNVSDVDEYRRVMPATSHPFDEELVEMKVQYFDPVEVEDPTEPPPRPEVAVEPGKTIRNGIAVPTSVLMMDDGKRFKGKLEIENRTNFYYGFVMKTNFCGKNGYYAMPGIGSIPPGGKQLITVSTTQVGYTSLLSRGDRLIMAGVGMPRRLKQSYLTYYLMEMLKKYPQVGEKISIKPVLKQIPEEEAPLEERFKNRQRLRMNKIMNEITSTHLLLRDCAVTIRSHVAKENFLLIVFIIAMILFFVNQNHVLTELVDPVKGRRSLFGGRHRDDDEPKSLCKWCSRLGSLF